MTRTKDCICNGTTASSMVIAAMDNREKYMSSHRVPHHPVKWKEPAWKRRRLCARLEFENTLHARSKKWNPFCDHRPRHMQVKGIRFVEYNAKIVNGWSITIASNFHHHTSCWTGCTHLDSDHRTAPAPRQSHLDACSLRSSGPQDLPHHLHRRKC